MSTRYLESKLNLALARQSVLGIDTAEEAAAIRARIAAVNAEHWRVAMDGFNAMERIYEKSLSQCLKPFDALVPLGMDEDVGTGADHGFAVEDNKRTKKIDL